IPQKLGERKVRKLEILQGLRHVLRHVPHNLGDEIHLPSRIDQLTNDLASLEFIHRSRHRILIRSGNEPRQQSARPLRSLLLSERGESHMGCPTPPWEHVGAEVATEMINPAGVEELLFPCNPATQPCEVIRTVVLPTIGGQAPVLSPT